MDLHYCHSGCHEVPFPTEAFDFRHKDGAQEASEVLVVSSVEGSKVVSEATEHGVYFEIAAPALGHLMPTDVVLVHDLGLLPTPDEPNLTTPGPGWQVPELQDLDLELQGLDLEHLGLRVHSLGLLHEMLRVKGVPDDVVARDGGKGPRNGTGTVLWVLVGPVLWVLVGPVM